MKRVVILASILFLMLMIFPAVMADEATQINQAYSCLNNLINSSGCTSLSTEQKIFSVLAVDKCVGELKNDSHSNECWPGENCDVKTTAQAILALEERDSSYNSTLAVNWLLSHKTYPANLKWYLEIETDAESSCTIYYTGHESGVVVNVAEDKKLSSSGLGNCLNLAQENYLIEVSPSCYNQEIDISCDEGFLTTLIFKMEGSNVLNVLDTVQESSAGGTTTEKIDSYCFSNNPTTNECTYEGSLWASQVLFALDKDVSAFLPYIVAFSEKTENKKFLSQSFLYYMTGKFKPELLGLQVRNKYWVVSGDEYYDTALALFPLRNENPIEKQNSKNWLLGDQQESGCWDNNNLRNTAFILYSIWPRGNGGEDEVCGDGIITGDEECEGTNLDGESCVSLGYASGNLSCYVNGTSKECTFNKNKCILPECNETKPCPNGLLCSASGKCYENITTDYECETNDDCKNDETCSDSNICVEKPDCKSNKGFCMSASSCDGNILSTYKCDSVSFKCCDEPITYGSCISNKGEVCSEDEICEDDDTVEADNLDSGEVCCLSDCVEDVQEDYTCSINGGRCRDTCLSDEKISYDYTCGSGDDCCVTKAEKKTWFIWVLIGLILIVILGIVFREKISEAILKLKHKSRKSSKSDGRPVFGGLRPMSPPPGAHTGRPVPRRILPPTANRPRMPPRVPPKTPSKTSKDLDDVLKKLREMGK